MTIVARKHTRKMDGGVLSSGRPKPPAGIQQKKRLVRSIARV